MTPDEREQINHLCKLVQEETDPAKFDELVKALNDLLESKHRRIRSKGCD